MDLSPRTTWQALDRAEVMGHRESLARAQVPANGSVVLDPTVATCWLLDCAGNASVSVAVPGSDAASGAQGIGGLLYGLKVFVVRPVGAVISFPGVLWSQDVRDPDGQASTSDSLVAKAATAGGSDVYTLVVIPGRGTWGFLAGRGFS